MIRDIIVAGDLGKAFHSWVTLTYSLGMKILLYLVSRGGASCTRLIQLMFYRQLSANHGTVCHGLSTVL